MAFQMADIDTIKAAIATGAKKVRYRDGREVEYRTMDEMLTALTRMEAELGLSKARRPIMLMERFR